MSTSNFDELAEAAHANSVAHGFYDGYDLTSFKDQGVKLALMHSEVTETMEALRKQRGEREVLDEISDVLIRTLDFYAALKKAGVVHGSLDNAYDNKTRVNKARPHMHGHLG